HVREESQEFIADCVPEVQYTVLFAAKEPGAKHDIGLLFDYGPKELGIVFRVVLKVGILDEDDIAGSPSEAGPERCPLAAVSVVEEAYKTVAAEATEIFGGAVRGEVVYDHKILLEPKSRRHSNSIEHVRDRPALVVHGNHD